MTVRTLIAGLHLRILGLAHSGSTSALLAIASARKPRLSVSQLLAEPAGHRVTLTRRYLIGAPLVIRTNANPDHAAALADLRAMFKTCTGREYLPRRGDLLTH